MHSLAFFYVIIYLKKYDCGRSEITNYEGNKKTLDKTADIAELNVSTDDKICKFIIKHYVDRWKKGKKHN